MKSKDVKLSVYIILIWVLLLTIVMIKGGTHTQDVAKGGLAIWAGFHSIYTGIVIILSFYYSQETFVFSWISWFFKHFFMGGGEKMQTF